MSKWFNLSIPRKYLGRMTEKGYYIKLPRSNWYITVPTKLVRINEDSDFFILVTKNDFVYDAVEKSKDSTGTIKQTNKGFITGKSVAELFVK